MFHHEFTEKNTYIYTIHNSRHFYKLWNFEDQIWHRFREQRHGSPPVFSMAPRCAKCGPLRLAFGFSGLQRLHLRQQKFAKQNRGIMGIWHELTWYNVHLVGGIPTPLKNMQVSWDDYSHILWKNQKCSKPPTSNVHGLPSGKRTYITNWKDPPFCSWVNQLFRLGHFQVRKL